MEKKRFEVSSKVLVIYLLLFIFIALLIVPKEIIEIPSIVGKVVASVRIIGVNAPTFDHSIPDFWPLLLENRQIQIIEESKQPQYMMLERFRDSLAEVCKHVLARYRQFYPEGLEFYNMQEDPQGVQMVSEFFQWPPETIEKDVIIETKVSSASMSKSLRKQEMVALMDKLQMYYDKLMQLAMAATDPMNPTAMMLLLR